MLCCFVAFLEEWVKEDGRKKNEKIQKNDKKQQKNNK
tara:strand:- start:602 stop:712 length:111 start_codon:yes stop_codon:yes gene_type:complete